MMVYYFLTIDNLPRFIFEKLFIDEFLCLFQQLIQAVFHILSNKSNQFSYKTNRQVRKVTNESMINYDRHKYSVPVEYIDKLVEVEVINDSLHIYYSGKEISCHELSENRYNYKKEHIVQILEDVFPGKSAEDIEKMATNRLEKYDLIGQRGGNKNVR